MDDLRALYQEVIIDHNRNPRNFHKMPTANRIAEGYNPLCGDRLTIYLHVDDHDLIQEISFEGSGCAISLASASLMTEHLKGKSVATAQSLFEHFQSILTKNLDLDENIDLGKLKIFLGVREFPARVKCATLCWHTVAQALKNEHKIATTE